MPIHRIKAISLFAALAMGFLAFGCGTRRYAYAPRPAVVAVEALDNKTDPDAQVLANVWGIHRAEDNVPDHHSVEVELQIENLSDRSLKFDPSKVSVVCSSLDKTMTPLEPPPPLELAGGQKKTLTLRLPLPEGIEPDDAAARNLSLRVELEIGGKRVTRHAGFNRAYESRVRYGFYGGYLYFHPRRHHSHSHSTRPPPPRRGPPHKFK